ncbi:MAG TPA: DNA-processing protein DprA [Actinomycetales bacterium]|nr:DNA-processing protein DprA [Actinomycetales bacterium]
MSPAAELSFDWHDPLVARVAWSRLAEPGDARAGRLVAAVGPSEALRAVAERGATADGSDSGSAAWLARYVPRLAVLDPVRDLAAGRRVGARVVTPDAEEWPAGVDDLEVPPLCLWAAGPARLDQVARRSVSLVGARAATTYGEHVARELGHGLAERGFAVVSGLAYGIDAASHRGALAAGGTSVAVVAGGLDRPYPRGNEALMRRLAAEGAVVSEVPPGATPTRSRFLQRNRLIAALSGGTVVVEAAWRSGSLSTARTAERLGRPVGAVPGPTTSMTSAGCHALVRSGAAVLVTDADEVADLVGRLGADAADEPVSPRTVLDDLDPLTLQVLDALPVRRGRDLPSICRTAGVDEGSVQAALGRLDLAGLAERHGEGWRLRRHPSRAPTPSR